MKHQTLIKDDRGRICIDIELTINPYYCEFRYRVEVWHIPTGKRKWLPNDNIATPAEIYAAKINLWKLFKPNYKSL